MIAQIQVGQILPLILVVHDQNDAVVNISGATAMKITIVKPDKSSFTATAVLATDGTDGQMQYVTTSADLNLIGAYIISGTATIGTVPYPTDVQTFKVGIPKNAIITLESVKDYIGKRTTDYDHDAFLQDLINTKSSQIEEFTNGPVVEQEFADQIYDGTGRSSLYVRDWPITSLLTGKAEDVQYKTDPTVDWQPIESDVRFIILNASTSSAIRLYRGIFPKGMSNIKISTKAGFNPVPGDIAMVCMEMVAIAYKESNKSGEARLGMTSQTVSQGGGNMTVGFADMLKRHREVMAPYMRTWA